MTDSAKDKVRKFIYENRSLFRTTSSNEKKQFKKDLELLLLEHERDTRYTAINNVLAMDYELLEGIDAVVIKDEVIHNIHNLTVGGK